MSNGLVDATLDRIVSVARQRPAGDPLVVYLAHPVGKEHEERKANLGWMQTWFTWLIKHTDWCVVVPWFVYVSSLDETEYRERGIRDDLAVLRRCDAVVLCGRCVSEGMAAERAEAERLGLPVLDLTRGESFPPDLGTLTERVLMDGMAMRRLEVGARNPQDETRR